MHITRNGEFLKFQKRTFTKHSYNENDLCSLAYIRSSFVCSSIQVLKNSENVPSSNANYQEILGRRKIFCQSRYPNLKINTVRCIVFKLWCRNLLHYVPYNDPRGRLTVNAGSDHYFQTWCLYVRPDVLTSFPIFKISQNKTYFKWE